MNKAKVTMYCPNKMFGFAQLVNGPREGEDVYFDLRNFREVAEDEDGLVFSEEIDIKDVKDPEPGDFLLLTLVVNRAYDNLKANTWSFYPH